MLFTFPWRWGSVEASVATVEAVPLWTRLAPVSANWQTQAAQIQPRFERIMVNEDTGPQFVRVTDVVS